MRILITGGAGFIGSNLTRKYLECGDEVYIIDKLSTGSMDNINDLINQYNSVNSYEIKKRSGEDIKEKIMTILDKG